METNHYKTVSLIEYETCNADPAAESRCKLKGLEWNGQVITKVDSRTGLTTLVRGKTGRGSFDRHKTLLIISAQPLPDCQLSPALLS